MHTLRSLRMWASLTRRGEGDSGLPVLSRPGCSSGLQMLRTRQSKAQVGCSRPHRQFSSARLHYSRKVFFKDLVMNRSALMKHDGDSCLPRRTPRVNFSFNIVRCNPQGVARTASRLFEAYSDSEILIESRHLCTVMPVRLNVVKGLKRTNQIVSFGRS
jgi:hypothetical protein